MRPLQDAKGYDLYEQWRNGNRKDVAAELGFRERETVRRLIQMMSPEDVVTLTVILAANYNTETKRACTS